MEEYFFKKVTTCLLSTWDSIKSCSSPVSVEVSEWWTRYSCILVCILNSWYIQADDQQSVKGFQWNDFRMAISLGVLSCARKGWYTILERPFYAETSAVWLFVLLEDTDEVRNAAWEGASLLWELAFCFLTCVEQLLAWSELTWFAWRLCLGILFPSAWLLIVLNQHLFQ